MHVKVRDLGEVSSLLNLNIKRISDCCITLDQHLDIEKLLREDNMLNCNGHFSPLNVDIHEVIKSGGRNAEKCDEATYRRAKGNLLYLANCTRPDLSYAVSFLGQFCSEPLQGHWLGVKHVLRYLKQTKDLCLTFSKEKKPLRSYYDSDFAKINLTEKAFQD